MSDQQYSHPACWCFAPSTVALDDEHRDRILANENRHLAMGTKMRAVVFDIKPVRLRGLAFFDAKQNCPSHEQLARLYKEVLSLHAEMMEIHDENYNYPVIAIDHDENNLH
jgi:hypothetical protein